jgi:hypothetical protein
MKKLQSLYYAVFYILMLTFPSQDWDSPSLLFSNSLNLRAHYSVRFRDRCKVYIYVSIFSKYIESVTPPSSFWRWGMILNSNQSWQSATGCLNMTFWKAECAEKWKSLLRCGKRRYYSWDMHVLLQCIYVCYYILELHFVLIHTPFHEKGLCL